jgi:hypothetical protein
VLDIRLDLLAKAWTDRALSAWHNRRLGLLIGGLAVAVSLTFIARITYDNREVLVTYRWRFDYMAALMVFIWYSAALLVAAVGWNLIMGRLTGVPDFRRNFKLYCYTNLVRRLPGLPWWLLGRVYLYEQDGVARSITTASSLVELAAIILSGGLIYLTTQFFSARPTSGPDHVWLLALLFLGLLVSHPRLIQTAGRRLGWTQVPTDLTWQDTLIWVGTYAAVWAIGGMILLSGINIIFPLPVTQLPGVTGAWTLSGLMATLITLAPMGLGIKEATLTLLLQPYMPVPLAAIVAILLRVELTLAELTWAVLSLRL